MTLAFWFHKKSLSFHHFLEAKLVRQLGQTWMHVIISFVFIIRHHKHILLIEIGDINTFVLQEMFFFYHLLRIKGHPLIRTNKDTHPNPLSFQDWAP